MKELDYRLPLYYGDSDKLLLKGAGQSVSSEFPGRGGTTLVGGHDTTFFAPLANAQIGDSVILTCTYGKYEYNISDISIIQGADYKFEELMKVRKDLYYILVIHLGIRKTNVQIKYYIRVKR